MRVQDISNFKLSVNNGEAIDLPSTGIDVSISDSIYRVSPEMVVTVPDPSGILIGIRAGGYGIHYDFTSLAGQLFLLAAAISWVTPDWA